MGTVEAQSKDLSECSSPSPENDKNELREALCALKNGTSENGVGFSGRENQGFGDGGVVEVVKSGIFEAKGSIEEGRRKEDGCQGLADSEMNGVSSLLKMRGSGRNLMFSYGSESDGSGKMNALGRSLEDGMEGGREDRKQNEDDGIIGTMDVPIDDTSDNKDLEMEDLGDEGYGGCSVGDFVWGKVKSHPWWPGRIYDPSDASEFALKLRQKNRLLVAYFGDGTFAWCHPSQLKPFEDNFENMVIQSSSRAFVNAVQEAVNELGNLLSLKMSYSNVEKKTSSEFSLPMASNSGVKEGVSIPESGIGRPSDVLTDSAELLYRVKQIAKIISIPSILKLEILKARLSAFFLARGGYRLPMYEAPQPVPGLEDNLMDETADVGSTKGAVGAPVQGPIEEDYPILPLSPKSGELSQALGIPGNRLIHRIKQKSIAEIMGDDKSANTKNKEVDATEKVAVGKKRKGREDVITSKPVRKGKGLLPNTDRNVESAENDGSGGKENSVKEALQQLKEKRKTFVNENTSSESKRRTEGKGKAREQNDKGSLSRERKKSKYLSPPFTIPAKEHRKGDVETESLEVSELVTIASDQLLKSPAPLRGNDEAFQENFPKESAIEEGLPGTPKDDENKTIDTTKIQVPSWELLSEIHFAAISPQIPRDINSLKKFVDFIFIYKSSLHRQGSYYKVYKKYRPSKKRKKPESDIEMLGKDQNQSDHISSPNSGPVPKRRRKNETTSGLPKERQAEVAKTGKKQRDGNSSAALIVSFGPGSSLPSKSDLITQFSKFGALNESETSMSSSNYIARVLFLKASDAEKALSQSQSTSPFGSSETSFRLEYLSSSSKSEKSKYKASSAKKKDKTPHKPSASLSLGSEASKLNYIKQKLQGLTSMLEASDGKSSDMKTKFAGEVKGLLEDVNKMVESSSS